MKQILINTQQHCQFINIDRQVQQVVREANVNRGMCQLFVPHTTAAITINENADPDVVRDVIKVLDKLVPWGADYTHTEGNSAAHVKASLLGFSETVFIEEGRLDLGTWQSLYFCEFDGPRTRKLMINVLATG
ncbi:MAG TPA: YjbQ family protein [Candidatus Hydrogenedentes bacterium]|nr:YjbQ family protein [Candidatus Hydrogenedentota bacterium]